MDALHSDRVRVPVNLCRVAYLPRGIVRVRLLHVLLLLCLVGREGQRTRIVPIACADDVKSFGISLDSELLRTFRQIEGSQRLYYMLLKLRSLGRNRQAPVRRAPHISQEVPRAVDALRHHIEYSSVPGLQDGCG